MTDQRTVVLGSAECPSSVTEPGFYVEVVAGALAGPYTQRGAVHASSRRRNQGQSTVGTVEVVRLTAGGQEFRVRKSGTGATMTVVEDGEVIVRTYYADRAAAERAAAVSAANAERRLRAAARSAVTA